MRRVLTFVVAMLFVGFSTLGARATADDSVYLSNGEWPPYLGKDLPQHGIASHIVARAFALVGVTTKYDFLPWKRALVMAANGSYDGSVVWSRSDDREEDFLYSDPVVNTREVFFYRRGMRFDWQSYEDLNPFIVGVSRGYFYGSPFHDALDANLFPVEIAETDLKNLQKLLLGRIDLFVVEQKVGEYILKRNFERQEIERLAFHPRPVRETYHYLIISKAAENAQSLVEQFNTGLRLLRQSGEYERILLIN